MVTPNGIITTVAGNGQQGISGDGWPATVAEIASPSGLAVDPAGKVYVSDYSDGLIRLLTPLPASAPAINANGVVDGATFHPAVVPGGIASLFGTNLGATASASALPLPDTLGGASVTFVFSRIRAWCYWWLRCSP